MNENNKQSLGFFYTKSNSVTEYTVHGCATDLKIEFI